MIIVVFWIQPKKLSQFVLLVNIEDDQKNSLINKNFEEYKIISDICFWFKQHNDEFNSLKNNIRIKLNQNLCLQTNTMEKIITMNTYIEMLEKDLKNLRISSDKNKKKIEKINKVLEEKEIKECVFASQTQCIGVTTQHQRCIKTIFLPIFI